MPLRTARVIGMFCVALSIGATPIAGAADFDKGLTAARSGDYAAALQEFRPLAEQGDATAQYNLGGMYASGDGVPQNDAEAVTWYRKAAEQGDATAQNNLGVMYDNGQGVPQDYAKTAQWYRRAAEQGDASAQFKLGLMYYKGTGVTRNPVMVYVVSNLAAAQEDKKAREVRDIIAKTLSREQIAEGQRMASEWRVGTPLPYFKDFKTWP